GVAGGAGADRERLHPAGRRGVGAGGEQPGAAVLREPAGQRVARPGPADGARGLGAVARLERAAGRAGGGRSGRRGAVTTGEAELRALVERQRGLYGQLDALSQRQRSLAEAGEAERLLAVVQERGPLVAALSANGARIGELVAQGAASDPGLAR